MVQHSSRAHVFAILCFTAVLSGLVTLVHYGRLSNTLVRTGSFSSQSSILNTDGTSTVQLATAAYTRHADETVVDAHDIVTNNKTFETNHDAKLNNRCVLYDRPPRTGSTTVSSALSTCLRKRGFIVNSFVKPDIRNTSIARGLRLTTSSDKPGSRTGRIHDYAIVVSHVWMTEEDIRLLRENCGEVMYITSTAPMWERVWSAAKMVSVKERNGNTRLDRGMLDNAAKWLSESNRPYARFYDVYPWIRLTGPQRLREDGKHMEEIPHQYEPVRIHPPFHPDFIITKQALLADLGSLLIALGCKKLQPRSTNVHQELDDAFHAIDTVKRSVVDAIGHENGSSHAYFSERYKHNTDGLERISAIMRTNDPA